MLYLENNVGRRELNVLTLGSILFIPYFAGYRVKLKKYLRLYTKLN